MNINSANLFNKSISRLPAGQVIEFIIDSREILGFFVENRVQTSIKVSATLQDGPRADRCSAFIFLINPNKPHIF